MPVAVETSRGRSRTVAFTIHTTLGAGALDPEAAMPGDEVTVKGQGFVTGQAKVTVAGRPAQVVGTERTALRFKVPAVGAEPGSWVPVVVQVGGQTAKPIELLVGRLPVVLRITPPRGAAGDRVSISGRGFAADANANAVTFAGAPALVLQASAQDIQALVPPRGARAFKRKRRSWCGRRATPRPTARRSPWSAPQGGPTCSASSRRRRRTRAAGWSSSLPKPGPVLLLSSPEGAPSATSRAIKVAAAINGALDQARTASRFRSKRATIRSRAWPSREGASSSVQATPDDSAAYASPPGVSSRAGVPTLTTLAEHWAALLNDCLAVFVQNEKPTRLLALSSRGRAFLELRSALGYRPGSGVAAEKVATLSPDLYQRVREASLFVAGAGQGSPAAAVEGTWEGEMEDAAGARAIAVRLHAEGAALSGRLINRTGGLAMEVPLKRHHLPGGSPALHPPRRQLHARLRGQRGRLHGHGHAARRGRRPGRRPLHPEKRPVAGAVGGPRE